MRIQERRNAVNMTQETLANKLGVTQAAIAMWETGKALPRAETLVELAKVLGCTIDELMR